MFPQSEDGKYSVCWFWLTLSDYCIRIGDVTLFESSAECLRKYPQDPSPYLTYQYARFLEDFFRILPSVTTPIPPDLYCYIDTEEKYVNLSDRVGDWFWNIEAPTEKQNDIYDDVCEFLLANDLDSGHLVRNSKSSLYRLADTIRIRYDFRAYEEDGTPIWSAGCGEYELPYNDFICEVEDMLVRFFRDMDRQVENAIQLLRKDEQYIAYEVLIARDGEDYTADLGIDRLAKEHAERKATFWNTLNAIKDNTQVNPVNWEQIKSSIEFLMSQKK